MSGAAHHALGHPVDLVCAARVAAAHGGLRRRGGAQGAGPVARAAPGGARAGVDDGGSAGPATEPQSLEAAAHDSRGPGERPLQAVASVGEKPGAEDVIDSWVGLDFGGDAPDPLPFVVPDEAPEHPEDPEAAREAFRALLNMDPVEPARQDRRSARPAQYSPQDQVSQGGNGRGRLSPVQARVYEYTDAGMTVSQISKELGIGKGEVRLIQSLREHKDA